METERKADSLVPILTSSDEFVSTPSSGVEARMAASPVILEGVSVTTAFSALTRRQSACFQPTLTIWRGDYEQQHAGIYQRHDSMRGSSGTRTTTAA